MTEPYQLETSADKSSDGKAVGVRFCTYIDERMMMQQTYYLDLRRALKLHAQLTIALQDAS